jgi:hypothetical protein
MESLGLEKLKIGASSPWSLTAVRDVPAGYGINFCYKCVSANQPKGVEFKSLFR